MTTTAQRLDRLEQMIATLIEAQMPAATVTPPVKEMPAEVKAARVHCYEARMTRRSKTALGGLTSAERSSLYHAHPELAKMTATKRAAAWKAIVVAYKATN